MRSFIFLIMLAEEYSQVSAVQGTNWAISHMTLAVDSKGNIYVAETNFGRRVQKFKLVDDQREVAIRKN